MGNWFYLPCISGSYLFIAFIKERYKRYTRIVVQNSNIQYVTLIKSSDIRRLIYSSHIRPLKDKKGLILFHGVPVQIPVLSSCSTVPGKRSRHAKQPINQQAFILLNKKLMRCTQLLELRSEKKQMLF
jgi:hypothetical protein